MHKVIKRISNEDNVLDGFSSVLNRVYGNRNIQSSDELDYSISKLLPYEKLKGINEAALLISDAIKNNHKIVIVGDKLLLITTPNEIEEKVDWLKKVIESTNMGVERFNQTQKIIQEAEATEELREHESIIRDALRMKLEIF